MTANSRNPHRSRPSECSYSRASRIRLRKFASRRSPPARARVRPAYVAIVLAAVGIDVKKSKGYSTTEVARDVQLQVDEIQRTLPDGVSFRVVRDAGMRVAASVANVQEALIEGAALVIANDADNFSVGANIGLALFAANIALWPLLENGTTEGQNAFLGLKYAPFPVVAAPAGMALGGGCEVCLHADAIEAHVETYMGLVETGVGLIPSWGGCKELLFRTLANKRRPGGPMPAIAQAFETISMAKVATSAAEARDMNSLRPADGITINRRGLVPVAKARALSMVAGYKPPEPPEAALPGPTAKAALDLAVEGLVIQGKATAYDGEVAAALARVLSGGDTDVTETVTEKDMLALERQAFLGLIRKGPTLDRIAHMLETGKPLRN